MSEIAQGTEQKDERTSWTTCYECDKPHTRAHPVMEARIIGYPRAVFLAHRECLPSVQRSLREGFELEVAPLHTGEFRPLADVMADIWGEND